MFNLKYKDMKIIYNAVISQNKFTAMMSEMGYDTQTTFYQDFSIADAFGIDAIKDTYNRAFSEWKNTIVYITELDMVLNHKIWEHYHKKNEEITKLYDSLWKELDGWCIDNLKGSDLDYFLRVTD